MPYPHIYLAITPPTIRERITQREQALILREHLHTDSSPTSILLNFSVGTTHTEHPIELLLIRPHALLVGAIRTYPGPIESTPIGPWLLREQHTPLHERDGSTPLQWIKTQRDAVRTQLLAPEAHLFDNTSPQDPLARTVGAIICAPTIHPESHIALDIDDHRHHLKIVGLDELAGLVTMLRLDTPLSESQMRTIATTILGGRLWHDGTNFLFPLAPARFCLHLLNIQGTTTATLPLAEGEHILGRRRVPRRHEQRIILEGDDLISADHAQLICGDNDRILLRDTSTNGTWIAEPNTNETLVRGGTRPITPGTLLRMGTTRMRLARIEESEETP